MVISLKAVISKKGKLRKGRISQTRNLQKPESLIVGISQLLVRITEEERECLPDFVILCSCYCPR